jgi:hypothetical protein
MWVMFGQASLQEKDLFIINQQSEYTFYKLMVWLFPCLGEESSSGESSVPYFRSIGQFFLVVCYLLLPRKRLTTMWMSSF